MGGRLLEPSHPGTQEEHGRGNSNIGEEGKEDGKLKNPTGIAIAHTAGQVRERERKGEKRERRDG